MVKRYIFALIGNNIKMTSKLAAFVTLSISARVGRFPIKLLSVSQSYKLWRLFSMFTNRKHVENTNSHVFVTKSCVSY